MILPFISSTELGLKAHTTKPRFLLVEMETQELFASAGFEP
jgi:hypothetical protein